jgi:UrcA family protein
MSRSSIRSIAAFFALAAATVVLPVQAGGIPSVSIDRISVDYSDLNLQTVAGAERLVTRIADAAKRACGGRPTIGALYHVVRQNYDSCVANAQQTAASRVKQKLVSASLAHR